MTDRELMQKWLDAIAAIPENIEGYLPDSLNDLVIATRERLAQPEQEPFGYFQLDLRLDAWVQNRDSKRGVAFYTTPPCREWQGLTDEDIEDVWVDENLGRYATSYAIEAKLKEKNT